MKPILSQDCSSRRRRRRRRRRKRRSHTMSS